MTIQGISFAGINALGTLMNGTGFGDYGTTIGGILSSNSLFAKILEMHSSVANNTVSVDDVSFDDTTDISPSVIFTLRELGNNREFGSGAFTAVVPGPYTGTLGIGFLHDAVKAHTSVLFGGSSLYMAQAIQNTTGAVENSRTFQPVLAQAANTFFGADPAENDATAYNSANYYLGSTVNNPIDMVLNGYNSLVANNADLAIVGSNFTALGTAFSIANPDTFGNPGQVVQAITALEFASLIQLDVALINQGLVSVQIDDLDQPQYNEQCGAALAAITNSEAVRVTKEMLGITNTQIVKMSDLTKFDKLFPDNNVLVANTLQELQQDLVAMELGNLESSLQFGNFLSSLLIPNMPTKANENRPAIANNISAINAVYTYNNQALNVSDFMGSVGGIGIQENVEIYLEAMNTLYDEGTSTALFNAAQAVVTAANTTAVGGTKTEAVVAALDTFTTQLNSLISKENINSTITTAIQAWEAIPTKIITEKNIQANFNLFLDIRTGEANFAIGFIKSLERLSQNTSDRNFLLGLANAAIASGDTTGEYLNAYISETVNYIAVTNNQARFIGGVQQ